MKLEPISEEQFVNLCNFHFPKLPGFHQEEEWWASVNRNVIGTVILDLIDKDWSWVILGRDQSGRFRAFDLGCSLSSQENARSALLEALLVNADTKIFPQ
jgi:hypothetical protein